MINIYESINRGFHRQFTKLNESLGSDISKYQEWVDYDMKEYGRISKETMHEIKKAGLSVVKDQYGDYEVIAEEADHDRKEESLVVENDGISKEDKGRLLIIEYKDGKKNLETLHNELLKLFDGDYKKAFEFFVENEGVKLKECDNSDIRKKLQEACRRGASRRN